MATRSRKGSDGTSSTTDALKKAQEVAEPSAKAAAPEPHEPDVPKEKVQRPATKHGQPAVVAGSAKAAKTAVNPPKRTAPKKVVPGNAPASANPAPATPPEAEEFSRDQKTASDRRSRASQKAASPEPPALGAVSMPPGAAPADSDLDSAREQTVNERMRPIAPAAETVAQWAQAMGADIVPSVPIEVSVQSTSSQKRSTKPQSGSDGPSGGAGKTKAARATLLSDWDYHLFNEGSHQKLWEKLGAHSMESAGVPGTMFGVWAPNAARVSVIGDWNGWNAAANPMEARGQSGVWEVFVPAVHKGMQYKFHIVSLHNRYEVDKTDPMGVLQQEAPQTASIVWDLDYQWNDDEWMRTRATRNGVHAPMSIYEVHIGSWRRLAEENDRPLSYRELAGPLAAYVRKMNFTHVELMPVMEHPFYGSWGYQCTGFFAPTSRFGTPQDFMYLIEVLHQNDIGVILDWVPSHFPTDEHGLAYFDGTHLYEHADPRKGFHPDWSSFIFNYGRNEVRSFLLSSALYWLGVYHADGLRVDAVASMLYLDYSRKQGEWIPNEFGGRENLEAIHFLRRLNEDVYRAHPDVQVIAEESTAWPMVSRSTHVGGLGFGMKWDMGWMHDSLRFFSKDPVHRRFHHNDLTFRMMYAFTENFVLPLSHDEVVHGKGSLIRKMPGDDWQKFANLRLLFAHMYAQPAKKLLFMGGEFGQSREWNHDRSLDWQLLDYLPHATLQRWVEDLNKAYRDVPALHELDFSGDGFEWIDCCDSENSVVSILRKSKSGKSVAIVLNFTPHPRHNYMVGVPTGGAWEEILNSDATIYGGSGQGNMGTVEASPIPLHGRRWSVNLTLPPLGAVFLLSPSLEEAELASLADVRERVELDEVNF